MESYDIIIIGAGVTGLAAGMYGGRLGLKTLIIGTNSSNELPIGGVITLTEVVENYPGFIRLTGPELAENMRKHALDYKDKVSIEEDLVNDIKKHGDCFTVKTKLGKSYISKTILFATGTKWRKLLMKGALKYESKGVHYCALCDGSLFRNKTVAVIGGSDSAAKEALLLSEYAEKVYMIYRGENIRPEPINFDRIKRNKKITVITKTNVTEIKGDKFVKEIVLDNKFQGSNIIKLEGVFGAIGSDPLSELAKKLNVKINDKNEIIINHATSETNVKGVYAAGDVADKEFKQAITGVAEGVTATYSAYKYINENNLIFIAQNESEKRK
ncbi:MAG: FAD-dependent oxidoreductase [Nanoarchaeota archaeon]